MASNSATSEYAPRGGRRRWLKRLAGVLILVAILAVGAVLWAGRRPLPPHPGVIDLPGLSRPVTVRYAAFGVPHIYAATRSDLMFAQGYVHAQDRWWTMDFYRHAARGTLAALIGADADAIANDSLVHTLGLPELAEADYRALDPDTRRLLDRFAAGVNAYIDSRPAGALAAEYTLLSVGGLSPKVDLWRGRDSLVVAKLLALGLAGRDIDKEIQRASVAAAVTPRMYEQWAPSYDLARHPTVIKATDLELPSGAPVRGATAEPTSAATPDPGPVPGILSNRIFASLKGRVDGHGSNAWVVAGTRTRSGKPMIAVDPHQGIEQPNVYHEIGLHLRPPGGPPFDIYGFAAAPFFGVLEGMNSAGAWATTNVTGGDSLDLYRLRTDPADPDRYWLDGRWRRMDVRQTSLKVAGAAPRSIAIRRTALGPVIPVEPGEPAYAVRWAGFERSAIGRASLALPFSRSFAEMRRALADWDTPPTNWLWAGRDGRIGFQEAGRFPLRVGGTDGSRPQDGTRSDRLWRGFVPFEAMPHVSDPADGLIATGNNLPAPPTYFDAIGRRVGGGVDANFVRDAARGYRAARIEELLRATARHDEASFRRIQTDVTVPGLHTSLRAFDRLPYTSSACGVELARWRGDFSKESRGAVLFARLWSAILRDVYQPHVPRVTFGVGMTELASLQAILTDPESGWWDDPATQRVERRDDRLPAILASVCASKDGTRWGDIHRTGFTNPIFHGAGLSLLAGWGSQVPVATFGGVATVSIGRWNEASGSYAPRHIPGYRFIHDLAGTSALAVNSTGQSSHPASPHYADQTRLWADGQYRRVTLTEPPNRRASP